MGKQNYDFTISRGDVFLAKERRNKSPFPPLIEIMIVDVKNKTVKIKWWLLGETCAVWLLWKDFYKQYELIEKIGENKNG
ncbi:TPA: hypothetical protein DCG86_09195 [Candidatus Marinimicrobia bacterium]|nr:MAG: hypothetical protein XD77_0869 [Marinimicrobia bacterium 46_47]HAE88182.1 hypothetical protein [Candidatus Neomarinimicrobiota bacterium]